MPQLPLYSQHQAQGASFAPYGEWLLPETYADTLLEYRAVCERVGLIDLSHDGIYLLSGEDRADFLQNIMSNDIHLATKEKGIFSTLLTAKGKVIATLHLYPLSDAFLMDIESVAVEKTIQHLTRFKLRSKIKIEKSGWGKLLVAGPNALPLLNALGWPIPGEEEHAFIFQEADPILCIRRTETGKGDYHLYCREDALETIFTALLTQGEKWGIALVGQAALKILQMEAGVPRYGVDMDETIIPIEAGLEESAISYTKGCYPGQEVVARIKTYGHVNRHLTGLILQGQTPPQPKEKIFDGDQEIGWVTSGIYSPLCKAAIAMSYVKTAYTNPGTTVAVSVNGVRVAAVVAKRPFNPSEP